MRRLARAPLGKKLRVWLWRHARVVLAAGDPAAVASKRWASRRPFDVRYKTALREALQRMASGVERCMYCEESAAYPIEHFWPKSRFPERTFCWENLLVACDHCNNRCKGDRFPVDERGEPLLINPTAEDPSAHLELRPREGVLVPRAGSRKGTTTIDLFKLNRRHTLIQGRKDAWFALQQLIVNYAGYREAGRQEFAAMCMQSIRNYPFSAALEYLLRVMDRPEPEAYLTVPGCLQALHKHHDELRAWFASAGDHPP